MNKEEIKKVLDNINNDLSNIDNLNDLNEIKNKYMSKKGIITELSSNIKNISNEDKKEYGLLINELRNTFNTKYEEKLKLLEDIKLNEKLISEKIDITLPDTFYLKDNEILLRSQTSPVQARTMLEGKGEIPIRMICPGKTYRRDDDDATHSHQFMQIEGLLVDKDISLSDLKGTFDEIAKKLFGSEVKTRFRPSYYQFTEPSVETDISCFVCHGKGCSLCKNTGWITVAGAGIVHPNVLRNCGYDPDVWCRTTCYVKIWY